MNVFVTEPGPGLPRLRAQHLIHPLLKFTPHLNNTISAIANIIPCTTAPSIQVLLLNTHTGIINILSTSMRKIVYTASVLLECRSVEERPASFWISIDLKIGGRSLHRDGTQTCNTH